MNTTRRTKIQQAQSIDFQVAKATKLAAQHARPMYVVPTYYGFQITDNRNAVGNSWTEVAVDGSVTFRDKYAETKARYGAA